jgi:hypothetical protein
MNPTGVNESDGFAIAMIVMLAVSMLVVFSIIFSIFRNTARRSKELEDEPPVSPQIPKKTAGQKEKPKEPWERDSDWWKK